jgi:predicted dehydrogenase
MQFNPVVQGGGGPSGGWPSWWMFGDHNGTPVAGTHIGECDIMEYFPSGTAGSGGSYISTLHNWRESSGAFAAVDDFNSNTTNFDASHQPDANWHTYGLLWTGNGTTGTVSFYFDNILTTHQSGVQTYALNTAGSPTAAFTAMEADNMVLQLGCATSGWDVNIDRVSVWGAP